MSQVEKGGTRHAGAGDLGLRCRGRSVINDEIGAIKPHVSDVRPVDWRGEGG